MTDFAAVDDGDATDLVAMMDATDSWDAVRQARTWVLDHLDPSVGALVLDVGCGPGTFGALAAARGATAIDVDVSEVMTAETRRRRPDARVLLADAARLPVATGGVALAHVERALQWSSQPGAVVDELVRAVAPGGLVVVTDTDWETFTVEVDDPEAAARWTRAASRWVPHPRVASGVAQELDARGCAVVDVRRDVFGVSAWDVDAPEQHDGPPGLPLRAVAVFGATDDDLDALAVRARAGRFRSSLTIVTTVARRP